MPEVVVEYPNVGYMPIS